MVQKRKRHDASFKAKVALDAIRERKTVSELASQYSIHTTQVNDWKRQLLSGAVEVFEGKLGSGRTSHDEGKEAELYEQIGRLKVELEWLKKKLPKSAEILRGLIEPSHPELSVRRQCDLLGLPRSTLYYVPETESAENLQWMRLIDEQYLATPFYGSRKMVSEFKRRGLVVNRKRVQRLMGLMGLEAIYPRKRTSIPAEGHKIYPYLLRGVKIERVNQVWSTDITYVPMRQGFMYLVAVMDWYSRYVLSWRLSNSLDGDFCIDALEAALLRGKPEVFNSDQGSQFTSASFTSRLAAARIAISMDGRGRALDNVFVERLWRTVKYEDIYLKEYATVDELIKGLGNYFDFYDYRRVHQGLANRTPWEVYAASMAA